MTRAAWPRRSSKCWVDRESAHRVLRSRHRGCNALGTGGRACPDRSRRDAGATTDRMCASRKLVLAFGLLLLTIPARASDLAILHNGFSIRHERREVMGSVTRLYLTADGSGYVDVSTDQIDRFEKDLSPAPAAVSPENSYLPAPSTAPENSQKL